MRLPARDHELLNALRRFRQLTARQMHDLVFPNVSQTPCDRAISRLLNQGLMIRIPTRGPGGDKGGSGQYIYMLPKKLYRRVMNLHSLQIVDVFLIFKRMEREGLLSINAYATEPDCWQSIKGIELRPDLYIDYIDSRGTRMEVWLEIDMGTENLRTLRDRMETFYKAYNHWDTPVFPKTIWVTLDDARAREIQWVVDKLPLEHQQLFSVCSESTLQSLL